MNKYIIYSCIAFCSLMTCFFFLLSGCYNVEKPKCEGPTPHIPDWTQSQFTNIHVGDSVKFTYTGQDVLSDEMGIYWEFDGGDPVSSDKSVVWVRYSAAGCFKVTLQMRPACTDKDKPFKELSPAVCVVE